MIRFDDSKYFTWSKENSGHSMSPNKNHVLSNMLYMSLIREKQVSEYTEVIKQLTD